MVIEDEPCEKHRVTLDAYLAAHKIQIVEIAPRVRLQLDEWRYYLDNIVRICACTHARLIHNELPPHECQVSGCPCGRYSRVSTVEAADAKA